MFEAALYYEDVRPGYGLEFFRAFVDAAGFIAAMPGAGSPCQDASAPVGARFRSVGGFPYAVHYVEDPSLKILAVAHVHRMPSYWFSRLTVH